MTLEQLKEAGEAPAWMTDIAYDTLRNGYLLQGETPKGMYWRLANSAEKYVGDVAKAHKFFSLLWNNWLCPSTPVAANFGTERGLPISCFGLHVADSTAAIFDSYKETAMLTKYGGGIGKYFGDVRGRGQVISKGGKSEGVIPWLKIEEATIQGVSQGGVRRGASASYLPIEHVDAEEFMDIRRQTGDLTRRCLSTSFHHAFTVTDEFMHKAKDGDVRSRDLWQRLLKTRLEMGEPYIAFIDNANKQAPAMYKDQGKTIKTSQLCNEIFLYTDKDHTFVCCLSSMNLSRYDEWKDTDAVYLATVFLDAVMTEFINKAKAIEGFENSVRFAEKSRALGLGVLGWHTYLQSKLIPFDSMDAMMTNAEVFRYMKRETDRASEHLAQVYGEPEWCKGYGKRNTHLMAVAPTVSNSIISGGVSQGIEPIISNVYVQKTAKGVFNRKNPALVKLLQNKGLDNPETWEEINKNGGSIQRLKVFSDHEKDVFQTAREINQFAIVRQAGQRQKWIDQGQSVNLFFSVPTDLTDNTLKHKLGKYIHDVHWEAWELGMKGLYYCRSESPLKGDNIFREASDCKACEA